MLRFLQDAKPDPNDIVAVRDGLSVVLHVPGVSSREVVTCGSYDEACERGRRLAQERNVDFWVAEPDAVCLVTRRRG
ncbi:MAG TPA: hypothetical protein VFA27_05565 [Vicinamibacterales bacterium]|nr:hypothetical protein [Vicinamibacterales bacterium]